jgi:hypothetical protein
MQRTNALRARPVASMPAYARRRAGWPREWSRAERNSSDFFILHPSSFILPDGRLSAFYTLAGLDGVSWAFLQLSPRLRRDPGLPCPANRGVGGPNSPACVLPTTCCPLPAACSAASSRSLVVVILKSKIFTATACRRRPPRALSSRAPAHSLGTSRTLCPSRRRAIRQRARRQCSRRR